MGHAYILKSKGQPNIQFRVLTYFLRFTDFATFCKVLVFNVSNHVLGTVRARAIKFGSDMHLAE